jgi:hypothetical protein
MSHLQRFVADLLEREDVLVEPIEPDGMEVLAPPRVQRALRIPEFCRLGFGSAVPPGAQRVGVEADWLERFDGLIGERGRCVRRVLAPGNRKLPDAELLLQQELDLGNATYKLLDSSPAWTRCLILYFRYSALSDEKRDGVVRLGVNLATGAVLDEVLERLVPPLVDEGVEQDWPEADALPPSWDRQRLLAVVRPALSPRLAALLEPFTRSLRRRLARDQERLYDYHNELQREAGRRLAALAPGDDGRRREQQRIEAIGREYRAKLDDLGHKYALRVVVEWVQTLDLAAPVQRLKLLIRRRKGERVVHMDWHPAARRLEPPPCEFGHASARTRLVCDEVLHLVGTAGLAACPGCGKPYCRACHQAGCPKCGVAATAGQDTGGSVASMSSATA